jgi:hypothetical protein
MPVPVLGTKKARGMRLALTIGARRNYTDTEATGNGPLPLANRKSKYAMFMAYGKWKMKILRTAHCPRGPWPVPAGPIFPNRGVRRGAQRLGGGVTLRSKTANPQ